MQKSYRKKNCFQSLRIDKILMPQNNSIIFLKNLNDLPVLKQSVVLASSNDDSW